MPKAAVSGRWYVFLLTQMKAGAILERHLAVIMRETLVALDYIHKAGIIHRDIKAANILVTRTGQPMLCDFGVAASFVQGGTRGKRSTLIGTPYWMAPEVILEGKTYDYKADIWSLGITAYEIATGNPPMAEQDQHRVIAMIPKNKPPRLPDGAYSPMLREFVAGCLDEDPSARLAAEDLARTKWIRAYAKTPVSVLRELLAQYATWTQAGGVRTSLIQGRDGPLALRYVLLLTQPRIRRPVGSADRAGMEVWIDGFGRRRAACARAGAAVRASARPSSAAHV